MRLWIVSDLHIESTNAWDLPSRDCRPQFDVLIVAGDLIPRMERGVRWLLDRVDDRPVIYVPGNHEFYGTDIDRSLDKAREAAAGRLPRKDVLSVVGLVDDVMIIEIIATQATLLESRQAWVNTDEALVNEGRPLPSGRTAELVDLLSSQDAR